MKRPRSNSFYRILRQTLTLSQCLLGLRWSVHHVWVLHKSIRLLFDECQMRVNTREDIV